MGRPGRLGIVPNSRVPSPRISLSRSLVELASQGSKVLQIEAERRVGRGFSIELEGLWFLDTEASPVLEALGQDDSFTVSVSRHF